MKASLVCLLVVGMSLLALGLATKAPVGSAGDVNEAGINTLRWFLDTSGYPTASYRLLSFEQPNLNIAVNRFAVFADAQCTTTTVSTDADCWSTTSGGDGNGVPVSGDSLFFDSGSGSVTGTMNANLSLGTGEITFCASPNNPITGCAGANTATLAIATFTLTNTGAWRLNGPVSPTVTLSTGSIDGGSASGNSWGLLSVTGAASLRWDALEIGSGTLAKGTASLTVDGSLTISGGLTSISGAVVVSVNVVITSTTAFIDLGSEPWTVSSLWSNASTSASWDAGTGTMTFDRVTGVTMSFAGTNLAENEFNNVIFNSTAVTATTFTMATRDLRANSITVTDSSGTTTLDAGSLNLQFASLTVASGGRMAMNGFTVETMSLSTSVGTIALTDWTAYTPSTATDISWIFNPDTTGATVTMTFGGLSVVPDSYRLLRDGVKVGPTVLSVSGSVTFSLTGDWSPHAMQIILATEFCFPPIVSQFLAPALVVVIGAGLLLFVLYFRFNEPDRISQVTPFIFLVVTIIITASLMPIIVTILLSGPC